MGHTEAKGHAALGEKRGTHVEISGSLTAEGLLTDCRCVPGEGTKEQVLELRTERPKPFPPSKWMEPCHWNQEACRAGAVHGGGTAGELTR